MIRDILQQYRNESAFNRDLGDRFERLMRTYLKLDPQYLALFEDVWFWKDWPQREALGYKLPDTGIDLVAKLRDEDGYCAIQCKFYDSQIPMGDLGNFFTLSGKGGFTQRLIVATAPLSKHAADALEGQTIPVELMTLEDLEASPIDWSQFSLDKPDQLRKLPKKDPRLHQSEALLNVTKGFQAHDRGKLIMACGTGKTYTSLIIAEQMVKPGQNILFLVPSIALLSQTLRAWTADARVPLRCFAVCSDSKASRNEEDMRIYELAYPATTNANKLAASLTATQDESAITVIFSTYQSIEVVHQAQQRTGMAFDLVVCDEAHRTAGYTAPGEDHSAFVRVHDNAYIKAGKRLYMTATPRIYAEASKSKAEENDMQVFSMDDMATFGPVFHQLRFDEAVRRDLLSDYKVLVIAVDELHVSRVLNRRIADSGDELKLDDAVKIVGCWNGLGKHVAAEDGMDVSVDPQPMRTAIAFAQSIKHSKLLTAEFVRISDDLGDQIDYLPALEAKHVDGTMNVVERNQKLSWLKGNIGKEEPLCRILTNARCLSEGVDVPALDAAIFLNPRDSVVDVVQSVGRVMRKDPAGRKKYGYVILPIGIRKDTSPETALDDNKKYRVVWQVLNALRAHDDRLDKQFATIDLTGKGNGVVNVIGVGGGNEKANSFGGEQLGFAFDPEELGKWQDAMFAKIVTKCGNRRYWEDWAKDIAEIADRHQMRIRALLEKPYSKGKKAFDEFLKGVRKNLNPSVSQNDAIEMLAQHIITKPVFDALFEGYAFTSMNPVSQSMQKIMDILEAQALDKEHETLEGFYASVRERASGITDPKGRQKIIVELYDKFFKTAFPRMVERLGIVYTPVEIVDFILHSADAALQEHFGTRLADQNVHILDPFTGTGTFPVRLIETGLIPPDQLPYKYRHDMHANEIVLLAYYIAAINIEEAFHRVTGQEYEPFPGIVLTDTFQMSEPQNGDIDEGLPENHERADRQKARDIRVIVGNPPYSVGQDGGNDNNQNLKYSRLDGRIAVTYAAHSTAKLKNSLYDSYIRAFRWASDRIKDEGIVCFVTNGGWIDGNTMDGFRKTLQDEFSDVYVFNLRGNQRTSGELSRKEGGKVFGSGSRTPVAITLLVKRKAHTGKATVRYHDIGDYLTREQKLDIITGFGSHQSVPWQTLEPNEHHDWINQRSGDFNAFVPFNDAPDAIFAMRSSGVKTNRDTWVYNPSRAALEGNVKRMIDRYNEQVALHSERCKAAGSDAYKMAMDLADPNPRNIKWTRELFTDLSRGKLCEFDPDGIRVAEYRPFCKQWVYFNRRLNNCVYQQPKLYPTAKHRNLAIQLTGNGASKDFSCLMGNILPDLEVISKGLCFPLYWYEPATEKAAQSGFSFDGDNGDAAEAHGYVKRDGITDVALANFRKHYADATITKEAIFYYCYGVLHSPEYREQYASDLKKVLPRIPYAPDFGAFEQAGRALAALHLDYEVIEPWPVIEEAKEKGDLNDFAYYRVEKMRFASAGGREKDKSVLIFNGRITLKNIPPETHEYVVNGKSALEWVMERYEPYTDKDSGIKNDPNEWCREHEDPTYILNLVKRVIRVSVETVKIVGGLPSIQ
ncbi:DEAD/DEAH box helicase [Pseudomonas oryzicola]|uniref:DEAD/DEAH box helicase family protein n=1 Tax=Pseudomonas oryzicola TaxID=485876 RepID=A0ABS6QET2_9PSED|nr:type ISP restriction/modification enzyme [Pseudomonas oryzicola]MBV4492713.1 DEAD/DEAH box helicase family protein [Pseudomonas oryzicola]